MAIRPVDLQQVVVKASDVTRDASGQQIAAAAQQTETAQQTNRHAQQAETVQDFEEAGAILIRDRQSRGQNDQEAEDEEQAPEDESSEGSNQGKGAPPQLRLGRHIDLQA